jgi:hypothetical protein
MLKIPTGLFIYNWILGLSSGNYKGKDFCDTLCKDRKGNSWLRVGSCMLYVVSCGLRGTNKEFYLF